MTPPSNKQTRKASEATARERAAALKAQSQREERRHKMLTRGGIGIVVVAVISAITVIGIQASQPQKEHLSGVLPNAAAVGGQTPPPWAVPADTATYVTNAGLTLLPNETLERHDHVHLDIYVDGKPTPVPAYIGIAGGANSTGLSSLHTHNDSGVIHIESPAGKRFQLGQVFDEWNVKLSQTQIGSLKTGDGKTLTVYVNGKPLTTDPNALELLKHQEIAIVYGTAAENKTVKVPSTYAWTDGL